MNNVDLAFKCANAAGKLIRESSGEQSKSVDYAIIAAELIAANTAEQTQLPPFAVLKHMAYAMSCKADELYGKENKL